MRFLAEFRPRRQSSSVFANFIQKVRVYTPGSISFQGVDLVRRDVVAHLPCHCFPRLRRPAPWLQAAPPWHPFLADATQISVSFLWILLFSRPGRTAKEGRRGAGAISAREVRTAHPDRCLPASPYYLLTHFPCQQGALSMAAGGDPSLALHDEATCSICLDYYKEPVMIVECGHNFCRACLAEYQGAGSGSQCPQCRRAFAQHQLRPNRHLGNMVDVIRQLGRQRLSETREAAEEPCQKVSKVCEKHKEAVKLFCQEDQAFICLICKESRAHKTHTALPLDEAAQEYKAQLQHFLTALTMERDEILKEKLYSQNEVQQLKRIFGTLKQSITHTFPEEEDKTRVALLDECNESMKAIDNIAYDFSERSCLLTKLISKIEDRRQQSAFECLQDIGDLLTRCKREVSEKAKADLKGRAESITEKMEYVSSKLSEFAGSRRCQSPHPLGLSRVTAAARLPNAHQLGQSPAHHSQQGRRGAAAAAAHSPARPQQQQKGNRKKWIKENVLLDPETAHPRYVISSDRKHVEWGDVRQEFRYNPKRFEYARCVLGTKGFYSGKHYWTVDVGDGDYWAVGVALESVDRDGELSFEPDEGVWAIARYCDQYKALTSPPTILEVDDEPTEIQISLNCDAGTVTFYDAEDLTRLYKFESIDFEEKVFPFFRITDSSTSLWLCS